MDLNQLLYFRTVAHLGNITRASELHYTTQSCISKNISRLEQEVGAELFSRRHGRLELTEAGRSFLKTVEDAVLSLQQGVNDLTQKKMNRTMLSISCTMNFRIDSILVKLAQKYPEHSFKVLERGYKHLGESFEHGELDLAFISRPHTSEELVCQRIVWANPLLVVHKDHPLSAKAEVSIAELKHEKFLIDLTTMDRESIIASCSAAGFYPDIRFQVKNILSSVSLLRENACVSVMPPLGPLFSDPSSSELCLIKIKEKLSPVYIGVAYPKSKSSLIETPVYQDLIDMFSTRLMEEIRAGEERWRHHRDCVAALDP